MTIMSFVRITSFGRRASYLAADPYFLHPGAWQKDIVATANRAFRPDLPFR